MDLKVASTPPDVEEPAEPRETTDRSGNRLSLKSRDCFLVSEPSGDIFGGTDGFFFDDTRILSELRLLIGGFAPSLLSAALSKDSVVFTAHLTNRPLPPVELELARSVVHIERARVLWDGALHERLSFTNYGDADIRLPVRIAFDSDFRDIFEVRGEHRQRRGIVRPGLSSSSAVKLSYVGLDFVERIATLSFSPEPVELTPRHAAFDLSLARGERAEIHMAVDGTTAHAPISANGFRHALIRARLDARRKRRLTAHVYSSGRVFNEWLDRSRADLAILTTDLPTGPYPYAGVPWFSTPFGRDAIFTALQTLWVNPALAKGVLAFLATTQAKEDSEFFDAVPGKILHETRKGEMAALGEVPFAHYYGSVDATPLFVILAGQYAAHTGDDAFIDRIWPNLQAAMRWIEGPGDSDGDGLVDYSRRGATGLVNQGWKDSHDSVFHHDGTLAKPPIALLEVQAYAFAAWRAMGTLAHGRGDWREANRCRAKGEALRRRVEKLFWMEDAGTYGIAIDGDGKLCRVSTSNAGHLLYVGLPSPERAARLARTLLAAPLDSGWGIRTLATGSPRYNPMSYHDGSVWPHDTALTAMGLARYGLRDGARELLRQMFEAAVYFDFRLPELFCGFTRCSGEGPIAYPVACKPQAWAAGSVFMYLQACLGIRIDARGKSVHADRPVLPREIERLTIARMPVGEGYVALEFQRLGDRTFVQSLAASDDAIRLVVHL